jgi:hypothetical protein
LAGGRDGGTAAGALGAGCDGGVGAAVDFFGSAGVAGAATAGRARLSSASSFADTWAAFADVTSRQLRGNRLQLLDSGCTGDRRCRSGRACRSRKRWRRSSWTRVSSSSEQVEALFLGLGLAPALELAEFRSAPPAWLSTLVLRNLLLMSEMTAAICAWLQVPAGRV